MPVMPELREEILSAIREASEAEREATRSLAVRASSIGTCPRQVFLHLTQEPTKEIEAKAIATMEVGTAWHGRIQSALKRRYPDSLVEREVLVPVMAYHSVIEEQLRRLHRARGYPEDSFKIRESHHRLCVPGHCDIALRRNPNDAFEVFEIKSKSAFGFAQIPKQGADKAHVAQAVAYKVALELEGLPVSGAVTIVYVNRDTGDIEPLRIDDMELLGRVWREASNDMASAILGGTHSGDVPSGRYAMEGIGPRALPWQCNYCPFGPITGRCGHPGEAIENTGSATKPRYVVR